MVWHDLRQNNINPDWSVRLAVSCFGNTDVWPSAWNPDRMWSLVKPNLKPSCLKLWVSWIKNVTEIWISFVSAFLLFEMGFFHDHEISGNSSNCGMFNTHSTYLHSCYPIHAKHCSKDPKIIKSKSMFLQTKKLTRQRTTVRNSNSAWLKVRVFQKCTFSPKK